MKIQRLRVTFSRGDELKYVTHLDMMRFWERALRRASVPVAYSEGFSPHAQIALAAPLAVGTTSDAELMDVFLSERMPPRGFVERVTPQLPPSVRIVRAEEAGLTLPSLQAELRAAEYEVDMQDADPARAEEAVRRFLAAETIPWQHKREDEVRSYDIRPLVFELASQPIEGGVRLQMLLRSDSGGSGRPEQVAAALGLPPPARIHRTRLVLASKSPVREAYRKHGRFVS
jgi:radical SAM-linked protein